tara:strand:+ start:3337 stop:4032 length:696 start_codon:yes stop_codon:yes gene_type:complete
VSSDESTDRSRNPNDWPAESRLAGTTFFLANSLASLVPGLGGAVAEVIGRRRQKRIQQFVELLVGRIENIEQKLDIFSQPACIELLEEAAEQACGGENDLKRITLARLIAASINDGLVNHETDRLLLAILGEMTDYELLHLLNHFKNSRWGIDEAYESILRSAQSVLELRISYTDSPQAESDRHEVQRAHKARLERLGLLANEGTASAPRYNSTRIARLLLRRVDAIAPRE